MRRCERKRQYERQWLSTEARNGRYYGLVHPVAAKRLRRAGAEAQDAQLAERALNGEPRFPFGNPGDEHDDDDAETRPQVPYHQRSIDE